MSTTHFGVISLNMLVLPQPSWNTKYGQISLHILDLKPSASSYVLERTSRCSLFLESSFKYLICIFKAGIEGVSLFSHSVFVTVALPARLKAQTYSNICL